tara:strand:+ start:276 stop:1103 length:828 start_codon:yes stop_codon:yes gene_type:complete
MVEATAKSGQIQLSRKAYTALRDAHMDSLAFAEEFDFVPARLPLKTSKGGVVDHELLQGPPMQLRSFRVNDPRLAAVKTECNVGLEIPEGHVPFGPLAELVFPEKTLLTTPALWESNHGTVAEVAVEHGNMMNNHLVGGQDEIGSLSLENHVQHDMIRGGGFHDHWYNFPHDHPTEDLPRGGQHLLDPLNNGDPQTRVIPPYQDHLDQDPFGYRGSSFDHDDRFGLGACTGVVESAGGEDEFLIVEPPGPPGEHQMQVHQETIAAGGQEKFTGWG